MTKDRLKAAQEEVDRWNRANPGQEFISYRQNRYQRLLAKLGERKRIYLDMKFWIWLRSPEQSPQPDATIRLLSSLRNGVASGRLLCPVSYPAFCELMKQNPEQRRGAQAAIMDELSLGIGLRNPFDSAELEYLTFFARHCSATKHMRVWVDPPWAPIGHMIVEAYPVAPEIPPQMMEECKKFMLEAKWMLKMMDYALLAEKMPVRPQTTAHRINQERKRFPRAGKTFEQLFADELHGCLDAMQSHIQNALRAFGVLCGVEDAESEAIDGKEMRVWINLFRETILRNLDAEALPSQRIEAALHAAIRMDDARLLKQNDLDDIAHSSVAAGYCDLFLTEDSFADLLRRKYVQSVIPKQCTVVSKIEEAITATQKLLS